MQPKNDQEGDFEQILGKRLRETTPPKSTEQRDFSCEVCEYVTKYKQNLVKHMRTHDEGRELAYLKHDTVTKDNGKRVYPCVICDKSFTHPTSLKSHLGKIHSKEELQQRGVNVSTLERKVRKKLGQEELPEEEKNDAGLDMDVKDMVRRLQRRLPILLLLLTEGAGPLTVKVKPETGFS